MQPSGHGEHRRLGSGCRGLLLAGTRLVPLAAKPVGHQLHLTGGEAILLRLLGGFQIRRHAVVSQAVEPLMGCVRDDAHDPLLGAVAGQIGRTSQGALIVKSVAASAPPLNDQPLSLFDEVWGGGLPFRLRREPGFGR